MKILLVVPPQKIYPVPTPSLGLAYVASMLRTHEHAISVLDLNLYNSPLKELQKRFQQYQPEVAGISIVTMPDYSSALEVASIIKTISNPKVIVGGLIASFVAEKMLREEPSVDIVVKGEGEYTMLELLRSLEFGRNLKRVAGIAFRHDGHITHTPLRPLIDNLDSLPFPAWDLFRMERYNRFKSAKKASCFIPVSSSRGCPFACFYCCLPNMWGNVWRCRSAQNVVDELGYLTKRYINKGYFETITFVDELFTASSKRVVEMCRLIGKQKLDISWGCQSRVDTLTFRLMEQMSKSGCTSILIGVESASSKILKAVNRQQSIIQVGRVAEWAKQLDISLDASFVIGLPGENADTVKQTIALMKELKNFGVNVGCNIFTPIIGSRIFEEPEKFGIEIIEEDWDKYSFGNPVIQTRSLNSNQIYELYLQVIGEVFTGERCYGF